jgi:hypothetical protein
MVQPRADIQALKLDIGAKADFTLDLPYQGFNHSPEISAGLSSTLSTYAAQLYDQRQQFGRQYEHNEDSRGKEIFRSIRGPPFLFQRS